MGIVRDTLYGYVIGDAMGLPLEYEKREKLLKNPVTDMMSSDYNDDDYGNWSDDTSLTLATMDSLAKTKGIIDYDDIMERFCNWVEDAKYTSNGISGFSIDNTTRKALTNFHNNKEKAVECGLKGYEDNNNASLTRMMPIALYCYKNKLKESEIYNVVRNASSLTHSHQISIMGCYMYVRYLLFILNGKDKYSAYNMLKFVDYKTYFRNETINEYGRILEGDISKLKLPEVSSSDYIVDTLETTLWVILNTKNYPQSIIGAINLGGDTDTIGAITGSISGLIYGYKEIPLKWLDKIKNKNLLIDIMLDFEEKLQFKENA